MDAKLGDLQVEIANNETRIMMKLIENVLPQTQYFIALVNNLLMLDV